MKIALLLAYSVAIFFVRTWGVMAAFALAVVFAAILARLPLKSMVGPLVPVAVLAAFAVAFSCASSPSIDGLLDGLFVGVRMIALVAASFVVCLTTTSTDLLSAFSWFIGPLRIFHVPVNDISLTLSLALRFIPVVFFEFQQVRAAQSARGATLQGVSFWRKLQIWGAAFSAAFVGLFRRADVLADAMDARCYGMRAK